MALLYGSRSHRPQANPAVHASGSHNRVRFKELYSGDFTTRLGMTLTNAQQGTHFVVPDCHFTPLSARCDQAEMVTELQYSQVAFVCTVNASEALTCLIIGLVVDVVAFSVSVDDLVHFVFPNEYHIHDITLSSSFKLFIG